MPLNLDAYVDNAIRIGQKYVGENLGTSRLHGSFPQESERIAAFFRTTPHPYEAPHVRSAVAQTLQLITAGAVPAKGERGVVYLAGGSSQKLLDAAADKKFHAKEIACLRHLQKDSVLLNFGEIRELFSKSSGEVLSPYAKWRGLISGIAQTVRKYADQIGSSIVQDDTLTGFSPAEVAQNVAAVARAVKDGNRVHIFAALISPEEAEAIARKQAERLKIAPQVGTLREAQLTAEFFRDQWPQLVEHAPNATIFASDLREKPIFVKRDNEIIIGGPSCPSCGGYGNGGYQMSRRDPG